MRPKLLFATLLAALCAFAGAQSFPPAWSSTAHYQLGDIVQENQNVYRCTHAITTPNLDPSKAYFNWELWEVRLNTTLTIGAGQTFPTLDAAWAYALNARVSPAAYLHFYIVTTGGSYTESPTKAFSLDHPYGAQISIIGDKQANIDFEFEVSNGFVIDSNHTIALISNIQVTDNNTGPMSYIGLVAQSGATLPTLANLNFQGFFSSYVYAGPGTVVDFTSNDTFHGNNNTLLQAEGGTLYIPAHTTLSGGDSSNYSIYAINRARVFVGAGSQIVNCSVDCIYADFGSFVNVSNCTVSGGGSFDIVATHASNVIASGSPVTSVDASSNVFSS